MEDHLNTIADSARALYDRGLYRDALEKYDALVQSQVHESALYFNLGNCYTRLGELGEAKVNFERALLYDPVNESARHNLDWVNLRISESIQQPQEELLHWISESARTILQPETWTILSCCFILISLSLLIARHGSATPGEYAKDKSLWDENGRFHLEMALYHNRFGHRAAYNWPNKCTQVSTCNCYRKK